MRLLKASDLMDLDKSAFQTELSMSLSGLKSAQKLGDTELSDSALVRQRNSPTRLFFLFTGPIGEHSDNSLHFFTLKVAW